VKTPKETFYEVATLKSRGDEGGRCINCGFPIVGKTGLYYAKDIPGPFCRPECIRIYHEIDKRTKIREGKA
jgi:hypothetical protein